MLFGKPISGRNAGFSLFFYLVGVKNFPQGDAGARAEARNK